MAKKSKNEKLKEKLFSKEESSWLDINNEDKKKVESYCKDYKSFLDKSKTERLCVANIIDELKKKGFKDMSKVSKAKENDKLYKVINNKLVIAFIVGKEKNEFRLVGGHVDSPRIDIKPSPLYEDSELALFKSHYYGGIKKYQWVNVPLSLHGVIHTKKGDKITIDYGEKDNESNFVIPDLLPHLSKDQMEKKAKEVVKGEEMNIVIGNSPVQDKEMKERVKLNILDKLNKKYGIVEDDFKKAELEFVPAHNSKDIGFDESMIGGYGQDDKVCCYGLLKSLGEINRPKHTCVGFFTDKEEIGSVGNTGAANLVLKNFTEDYVSIVNSKAKAYKILENSKAMNGDVTVAMNPNYKDANEPSNVSYLGRGIAIEKYNGSGGKFMGNDASAEFMNEICKKMDDNKIPWQTGEIGKIDQGGGGTIAMFLAAYGMDVVDAGPSVLGMHSPFEVVSKIDAYVTYKAYKSFLSD